MSFVALSRALLVSSVLIGSPAASWAQNLRQLAQEQAKSSPDIPIQQPAPPAEYWPKSIEELAKESNLVVQATLTRIKSYLAPSEDRVLTDYSITGTTIVAGQFPVQLARVPGPTAVPVLTVWGGEVVVEGVLVRGTDYNREPIRDGKQYLLFLRPSRSREAGQYEIHHGGIFEVSQDSVTPLLKRADEVFKGVANMHIADLTSRVRSAIEGR